MFTLKRCVQSFLRTKLLVPSTSAFRLPVAFEAHSKKIRNTLIAACGFVVLSVSASEYGTSLSTSRKNETWCEPSSSIDKVSNFQVMAALEVKEELEKVRLAQLIHDLHELAKSNEEGNSVGTSTEIETETATSQPPSRMRRYVTMIGDTISRRKTLSQQNPVTKNFLSATYKIQSDGDINADFLARRVSPDSAQSIIQAIKAGGKLTKKSLLSLIAASKKAFMLESSLIDLTEVKGDITVVGDLHGSLPSLISVLQLVGKIGKDGHTVVFDGDFVDRGFQSLEVLCIILLLKLAHPHYVFLLRGNHEDALIASVYGFRDEIRYKYGSETSDDLWDLLTDFFTVLPLAAQTKTAAILHGGIPTVDFDLNHIAAISLEERLSLKSPSVEATSDAASLVQNCLWSDPDAQMDNLVVPNPRGCGVRFGRRVARDFLERSGLKYLIRGHEPVEEGIDVIECGHGRKIITVFSAAAYPAGEGTNSGAILQLNQDGTYSTHTFFPDQKVDQPTRRSTKHSGESWHAIRSLIAGNKARLEKAFKAKQNRNGKLSIADWAEIMSDQLELPEIPWKNLQPSLAPIEGTDDEIDWKSFLDKHSGRSFLSRMDTHQVDALHENHKMLWTVFKFLDVDKDGKVNLKEFKQGIVLLNKHLAKERQLKDPDALFKVLDEDGRGSIDIDEFEKIFTVL